MSNFDPESDDIQADFVKNPARPLPCVLLLDTSGSMGVGDPKPIEKLNEGLRAFESSIKSDSVTASALVEIAIVTFDNTINTVHDFKPASDFEAPTLEATPRAMTHMASGILQAFELVEARKAYHKARRSYYQPWIFMITDGKPKGESEEALQTAIAKIQEAESGKKACFYAVGVGDGVDMEVLQTISQREPIKMTTGLDFRPLFLWLSASLSEPNKQQAATAWGKTD